MPAPGTDVVAANASDESVSAERRALAEILLRRSRAPTLGPRPADAPAPISFAQERIWLAASLAESASAYNEHSALEIAGPLQVAALWRALERVAARHEILRTVFPNLAGRPTPQLRAGPAIDRRETDLASAAPAAQSDEARRIASAEAREPFDLQRGPLWRVHLLRLSGERHIALVTLHHIIADAWSISVLVNEITQEYEYERVGKSRPVASPPIQYADYAYWQRQQDAGGELASQVDYWRERLAGVRPALDGFPARERRSRDLAGSRTRISLGKELTARLKKVARDDSVTPSALLLTSWLLILARYTGSDDIAVAMPVAGRNDPTLERVVGCFLNLLIVRCRIDSSETFRRALSGVQESLLGALSHQEAPFQRVAQVAGLQRGAQHGSITDVLFNFRNVPSSKWQMQSLQITEVELAEPIAKFPLALYVEERDGVLGIDLVAQHALIDPDGSALLLEQLRHLLGQVATRPDEALTTYSLRSTWPRLPEPKVPLPRVEQPRVTALVAAQIARACGNVAIRRGAQEWSYGDLAEAIRGASERFRAAGVHAGDVVAIAGAAGLDLLGTLLATWEAGASILLLDAAMPAARQRVMLSQACARWIVCVDGGEPPWAPDCAPAGLRRYGPNLYRWKVDSASLPDDAAYVFFTSGTSGVPKAVLGSHDGLSHFLLWQRDTFALSEQDRVAHVTGLSFDVVLRELLLPLITGASLCLPDASRLTAAQRLAWLREARVSILHVTPTVAKSWIAQGDERTPLADLRVVFFAGEPLPRPLCVQWKRSIAPASRLINLYGPTETTLAKSWCEVSSADVYADETCPIGEPLPDTQLLIISTCGSLCGVGEVGQIVIRTPYRSHGYLNDAQDTARRFERNPHSDDTADLWYQTGDLGRYTPRGLIQILGRADDQVKIQGMRVEPAEVAAALCAYPNVCNAAVLSALGEDGPSLLAYVVPGQAEVPDPAALRAFLATRLPTAMIPTAIRYVADLPITANGKLDRRALRELRTEAAAAPPHEPSAPREGTERTLADIWCDLFRLGQVSRTDDFFALGGHSLLATELTARLHAAFGVEVALRTLFEHPDLAGLAAVIDSLAADVSASGSRAGWSPLIADTPHANEPFPLTPVQEAYWVGRDAALELGRVATHGYAEYEMSALDPQRLEVALNQLIERHGMLRAVIADEGQQRILRETPVMKVPVADVRNLNETHIAEHLTAVRSEISHRVRAANQWPLFEVRLTQLPRWRSLVHVSIDALICDAWSRRTLGRELLALYAGGGPSLPALELSFRDYVLAERQHRASPSSRRAKAYWLNRIATLPPGPELPLARTPGEIVEPRFVRRQGRLAAAEWRILSERARARRLTPSGFVAAVYARVLGAWSRRAHFTLNLTLFHRPRVHPQIDSIVGDFTSLTLLEVESGSTLSFTAHAQRLQQRLWEDLDHESFSGVEVLRELNRRERAAPRAFAPVVMTSMLLDRGRMDEVSAAWLDDLRYGISQTPQVILDLAVSEQRGELVYRWDALEEMFPPGVLDDMFAAFSQLLRDLAASEEHWSGPLPGLLPRSHLQLFERANATAAPIPQGLLHSAFERQAQRHPQNVAVIAPDRRMTYAQLHQEARRLSGELIRRGVRRNELVAIVMDKGWEQIEAVLGILAAGAAYLPIDAALPLDRIRQLLEIGQVRVLLTQPHMVARLAWPENIARIVIDPATLEQLPAWDGHLEITQDDLAYVIFTSGSTGTPKGVAIQHGPALNTVVDINQRIALSAADRVLAVSSLSFDLSVYDIFGTLGEGGALVVPAAAEGPNPVDWLALVAREQVTVWNSVPALFDLLLDALSLPGAPASVPIRAVMLSGDWIALSIPGRARAALPSARLWSLGGATEASIWSIQFPVESVLPDWKSIPYGFPLTNQTMHVLNEHLVPLPVGAPGDLYIGGFGLAQGYWREPELTARAFVRHPATGERLYRTGDLARWTAHGWIEFLGREDSQVKINGFRVELGEIEAVLLGAAHVSHAVVLALPGAGSRKTLAAYVVAEPGERLDEASLRAHLRSVLPEYMTPAQIAILECLPMTPNGKVDRARLLGMAARVPAPAATGASEASGLMQRVCALWSDVFGTAVGPGDDFFELGGDSISAIKLAARMRSLGVNISFSEFFERPTVASIAQRIADLRSAGAAAACELASGQPPEMSHAQERIWFLCQREPQSAFYNLPAAMRLAGRVDVEACEKALRAVAARHSILLAAFPNERGSPRVQIGTPELVRLHVTDVDAGGADPGSAAVDLARSFAEAPFDLQAAPLWRAHLIRFGMDQSIVLLVFHHLVYDAHSIDILMRELSTFYAAFARGQSVCLPPIARRYWDFARLERARVADGALAHHLAYWRQKLSGAARRISLPRLPEPDQRRRNGGRRLIDFPQPLSEQVRAFCKAEGTTVFMTLLAVFKTVLYALTREADLVVTTSVSNREHEDAQALIGLFINTVALRTSLEGDPCFRELLRRVRSTTLDAYAHAEAPFDCVLESLPRDPTSTAPPFGDVAFTTRPEPQAVRLAGFEATPVELFRGKVKFDLELQIVLAQPLFAYLDHDSELVAESVAERVRTCFLAALSAVLAEPDIRLETLCARLADSAGSDRLARLRRRLSAPSTPAVAAEGSAGPHGWPPAVVRAPDISTGLTDWMREHRELVEGQLARYGCVLLRGYRWSTAEEFREAAQIAIGALGDYTERSTPRTRVSAQVYTSTEYPADQAIPLHNENSYATRWPARIAFACLVPADSGGETPVADARAVCELIPSEIREEFATRGVLYLRNYRQGLGLTWQDAFQCTDPSVVDRYCREARIEVEWLGHDRLRTRHVRPALLRYPATGQLVWFNQAHLFHCSSLGERLRASMLGVVGEEANLPRHAYFGDGAPIPDEMIAAIRLAYEKAAITWRWQVRDFIVLDNEWYAHGRAPFAGKRRILVAMSDMQPQRDQATASEKRS